jgi:hypothetical protein
MRFAVVIFAALIGLTGSVVAQNRSVYTSTRTSDCRAQKVSDDHGGDYVGRCRGVGGYKVDLIEGDLRQTLNIINPVGKMSRLDLNTFYGSFSYIGEKLEWRTKKGSPVALISRYYIADHEGGNKSKSLLFVTKISPAKSCVVDIVDAVTGQNEKARELADAAADKPCKSPSGM